jgi:hypothetical protein
MVIISNCEHLSLGFCEMGLIEGGAQLLGKNIRRFKSQIQADLVPNSIQIHIHTC